MQLVHVNYCDYDIRHLGHPKQPYNFVANPIRVSIDLI